MQRTQCPDDAETVGRCHHHHHHLFLNCKGRWGTTDDFALGLDKLQACPFPDVVFPSLPLFALSSSPFTVPCKMVLAKPDEQET